jgi:hypothetical protein
MISVLASGKGEGKTKKLIEMANNDVKNASGTVVFVDDDSRHIYDLHYDVRFIETADFPITDRSEFTGFVCGILAQDRDIEKFYIDGLTNILKKVTHDDYEDLATKLEKISTQHEVDFIISMNHKADELPEILRQYVVEL